MPWQVEDRNGIYLPQVDLWCDARWPTPRAFVSHAHFDHLGAHEEVICSPPTAQLMQARMPSERAPVILPFGRRFELTHDAEMILYPAGHIFGSSQCWIERAGESLLYTGDFKLRPGRSAEICATPRADVVIMETTFGKPRYVFPPTDEVLADIVRFCRSAIEDDATPVLFGYSLGKSQELLCGLAEAEIPIMVHPQTLKMTRIYAQFGVSLPPFRPFVLEECAGHVVVCPPQTNQSAWLRKIKARRTAMVTGWALDPSAVFRYQTDAAFPLSDHADYADLLKFVKLVGPKRVLTVHGFAREFARDLRDLGYDAWALGLDNQLELGLALGVPGFSPDEVGKLREDPPAAKAKKSGSRDAVWEALAEGDGAAILEQPAHDEAAALERTETGEGDADAAPAAETMLAFARTAEEVRKTASKLEKTRLLSAYLRALPDEDLGPASIYFTGRPFSQADGRPVNCGWSVLRAALLAATRHSEADFRATYSRFSDSGDTAEVLLTGRTHPQPWRLAEVPAFFEELQRRRGPQPKREWLRDRLAILSPLEGKYLVKMITGDLRIGLKEGLVEDALAQAFGRTLAEVREANMLTGDFGLVALAAKENRLHTLEMRVFQPLQFMLASPEPTAEAIVSRLGESVWIEEKYDGIRCQIHKLGGRVELYSRELKKITEQFPELARAAESLPDDFIGDGELLAWQNGRALPFADLQKRLGRKGDDLFLGAEVPVSLWLYDLLWANGISLLEEPLRVRREKLEGLRLKAPVEVAPIRQVSGAEAIELAFVAARQRGNEGLIAKDPASLYSPGRRGLAWLKLKKAYATLDVVVVGVEWGHGKRRGVLSDYTFAIRDERTGELLPVGKAYTGLTDVEIARLTEHFLENTLEDQGRYRLVQPDTIIEVAFDTIQPSARHASGYALRFPRIVRIREDKKLSEIDTLEHCRQLARATSEGLWTGTGVKDASATGVKEGAAAGAVEEPGKVAVDRAAP